MLLANNNLDTREITSLAVVSPSLPAGRCQRKRDAQTKSLSLHIYTTTTSTRPSTMRKTMLLFLFPFFVPFLFPAFCVVNATHGNHGAMQGRERERERERERSINVRKEMKSPEFMRDFIQVLYMVEHSFSAKRRRAIKR